MSGKSLLPSDSIRRSALAGWSIIALFFGGLGGWAAIAPLNGAIVANGVIKVEGNRKSVQHLDGGIVKDLRVKEGDRVNVGDVLLVLDDTQTRAEFEVLSEQYAVLRTTEVVDHHLGAFGGEEQGVLTAPNVLNGRARAEASEI